MDGKLGKYVGTQFIIKRHTSCDSYCKSSQKSVQKPSELSKMAEGGEVLRDHHVEVGADENNNEVLVAVPNVPQGDLIEVDSESEDDVPVGLDTDGEDAMDHLVDLNVAEWTNDPADHNLAYGNWRRMVEGREAQEALEHAAQAAAQVNAGCEEHDNHDDGDDVGGHSHWGLGLADVDEDDVEASVGDVGNRDLGSNWSSRKHQVRTKHMNEQHFCNVTFRVDSSLVGEAAGTVMEKYDYYDINIYAVNNQYFL